jgi:FlaG/FlaF family flagellin (archaellin)
MRAIKNNFRGVSNVIGALMLTLIVVGAATSFALFVSQRQEMQQESELSKVQKELENIDILNIEPEYDSSEKLEKLNFSIVNVNKDSVRVTGIWINKYPYYKKDVNITIIRGNGCKQNWSFDDTNQLRGLSEDCNISGTPVWKNLTKIYNRDDEEWVDRYVRLDLEAYETVKFVFDNISNQISFFDASQNEPLTIKIYTSRGNIFEKTFYPPSSVIRLITDTEEDPPGTFKDFVILDGSLSDHPGDNAYIQDWEWDIISQGTGSTHVVSGRIARAPDEIMTDIWNITLTVKDNFGMIGKSTVEYG